MWRWVCSEQHWRVYLLNSCIIVFYFILLVHYTTLQGTVYFSLHYIDLTAWVASYVAYLNVQNAKNNILKSFSDKTAIIDYYSVIQCELFSNGPFCTSNYFPIGTLRIC